MPAFAIILGWLWLWCVDVELVMLVSRWDILIKSEDQSSVPRDEFDFPSTKDLPSRSMRDCACDWFFYYLICSDQPNYLLYMVICIALTMVLEPCQLSEFCTRYILEGSTPLFTTYLSSSPTKFGSELYTCHQPIINLRLTPVNHSGEGPVG